VIFVPLIKAPNQPAGDSGRQRGREGGMEPWENVRVDTEGLLKWLRGRNKTKPTDVGGEVVFFDPSELGPPPEPPEDLPEEERTERATKFNKKRPKKKVVGS
jgi:hypothetical protein